MSLFAEMIEVNRLSQQQIQTMYSLMNTFYDQVVYSNFIKDLEEKDFCIILLDERRLLRGFSTQKLVRISVEDKDIHGVFSGDTIIHKDYWGSMELYKVFTQSFLQYSKKHSEFYWFLISKGYKTYKMLPLFFKSFYPNYQVETPKYEKKIMDAFGLIRYPNEYKVSSGVIEYLGLKDKLKEGVADITEKQLRDKNIQFFVEVNPKHNRGYDLVCLAPFNENNLTATAKRLFMGEQI